MWRRRFSAVARSVARRSGSMSGALGGGGAGRGGWVGGALGVGGGGEVVMGVLGVVLPFIAGALLTGQGRSISGMGWPAIAARLPAAKRRRVRAHSPTLPPSAPPQ